VRASGGWLLDVNSVHVPAIRHGFHLVNYLDLLVVERGGAMHLAGFLLTAATIARRFLMTHAEPGC
jgi:uncharacterized protein (UPF0276 family)